MTNIERGTTNGATRTIFISVAGAILSGAVVQLAAAIWWGASMMIRLEQAEVRGKENLATILRLEERGFRGIPVIEQQIKDLREQQSRIVQALDATYNSLQEHLRAGTETQRVIVMEERIRVAMERIAEINRELTTLEGKVSAHVYDPFGQHQPNPPPILAPPQRNRK